MNILGFIAWCAVLCVFFLELIFTFVFGIPQNTTPQAHLLILGILCILPIIPPIIHSIPSYRSLNPLFGVPVLPIVFSSCFLGIGVYFSLNLSISSSILVSFGVCSFFLRIGGKMAFSLALIILMLVPVCIVSGYNMEAELLIVYVYHFLLIGVLSETVVSHAYALSSGCGGSDISFLYPEHDIQVGKTKYVISQGNNKTEEDMRCTLK